MVGGLRNRAGLLVLAAISAADCAAHSMNSLGPFAVGELVRGGRFSIMQAGLWSCVEMLAYAVAMTAIAPLSARLRLRLVALLAGIGLVVAQAAPPLLWGCGPCWPCAYSPAAAWRVECGSQYRGQPVGQTCVCAGLCYGGADCCF